VSLAVQTADCQSILLYDPVRRAVGNIHSGWRGSIQYIIGHAVAKMTAVFGTLASDLSAGIGPALGPCCAEFIHYRREIPESLWQYRVGESHFDFLAMSRDQLQLAGVPADHIAMSHLCTRCRTDLFFSYRAEKTTGRVAAVIGLEV
jgi:polyphenol oxidase